MLLLRVDVIIRTVDDDVLVRTVFFHVDDDVDTTVLLLLLLCLVIIDDVPKIGDKTVPVQALASPIAAAVSTAEAALSLIHISEPTRPC